MIRVLVVDDHPTVRSAIRKLLETTEGMTVVGEAGDGREALDVVEKTRPDVVVMDLTMPELSGIQATRYLSIAHPRTRILIFSAAVGRDVVREARAAGAAGFVAKGGRAGRVVRAIRAVNEGRSAWPMWA